MCLSFSQAYFSILIPVVKQQSYEYLISDIHFTTVTYYLLHGMTFTIKTKTKNLLFYSTKPNQKLPAQHNTVKYSNILLNHRHRY